jgi:signal transduction histidine kinase/CheY-like chemotaxis protein
MSASPAFRDGPLYVLHLEDSTADAELVQATLQADGLRPEIVRVETRQAFDDALQAGGFDLILADYNLPSFDGLSAQEMAARVCPDVPFIFVSGSIGEEHAIDRVIAGATDYVLKDHIRRLSPAVQRALAESVERAERQRADAEVRRLNAELEQRVIARTQELAAANAALERREVELQETQSFLEDLVVASPSIVFRLHPTTFDVLYVSPNLGWVLGYHPAEVMAMREFWATHLHPDDAERVLAEVHDALARTVVQIEQEYRIRGKDGQHHWFFSLMRVEYGSDLQPIAMLRYCLDIADRKLAEAQLTEARRESERANHAKSEFLSRMSHDLRTPLNAILGFAQLLGADDLDTDRLEYVRQILQGGTHLLELINEVLDLARIEAGHISLSPEPVNASEIVTHALELVAPLAAERGISLTLAAAGATWCVFADRQRLSQILLNFLSNAVKYNRKGGKVVVDFAPQPGGRLRINVADTGAGIPAEKLLLLFKPFERVGAETTSVEGTGLGLALTRKLAAAMGGTVGVTSEIDRGSVFWIELMLTDEIAASVRQADPPRRLETSGRLSGTVLYVEDNLSNVRLMERIFTKRPGAALLHAASGDVGLAMARHHRPDAIFLDLHLPGLDGEEVLRLIREDVELRTIPVAVLSADATPGQIRRLLASGAAAYLTKPLDISKVLALLDDILADPALLSMSPGRED